MHACNTIIHQSNVLLRISLYGGTTRRNDALIAQHEGGTTEHEVRLASQILFARNAQHINSASVHITRADEMTPVYTDPPCAHN